MTTQSASDQSTINQRPAELLQNLIRFDTTNPPGNEAECINYINQLLTAAGFKSKLFASDPARPNLITRLAGQGHVPPLLLYGHVDVATTENQTWQYPPFEGKLEDGYVWGRGALDMKGGVAMMLAAFLRAKAEGLTPPGDVVLAILSDEECGGEKGAKYLVENHAALFKGIRYAIGEFGGFTWYIGQKKFYPIMVSDNRPCILKATVQGPSGHASEPLHGGATAKLATLLQQLDQRRLPVHIHPVVRQMVKAISSAQPFLTKLAMRQLLKPMLTDKVLNLLGTKGQIFEPLLHNTINVTAVHGGEHIWSIPAKIAIDLAVSLLPNYGPDDAIAELHQIIDEDVEFEVIYREPSGPAEPDWGLFDTLKDIFQEGDSNGIPVPLMISGCSDGRHLSQLGIQTYGFLPMNLPRDFAFVQTLHAADERIPVEALDFGTSLIYKVLQRFGN
jgi:acetylornithine deacetylase/succinyl-diaminopimelate desuccinylase-like protein